MHMQRPLKFRAWDPEARALQDEWIMSQDYEYVVPGETVDLSQLTQSHDLHVMQFTGFYDRHGQEIYEGDVLLSRESDTGLEDELFEMSFELGGFCLTDYPRSEESEGAVFYRNWFNSASRTRDAELPQPACRFDIVGHIYEPLERIEQRVMQIQESSAEEEAPLSDPNL